MPVRQTLRFGILREAGVDRVVNINGALIRWQAEGLATESEKLFKPKRRLLKKRMGGAQAFAKIALSVFAIQYWG